MKIFSVLMSTRSHLLVRCRQRIGLQILLYRGKQKYQLNRKYLTVFYQYSGRTDYFFYQPIEIKGLFYLDVGRKFIYFSVGRLLSRQFSESASLSQIKQNTTKYLLAGGHPTLPLPVCKSLSSRISQRSQVPLVIK